MMSVMIKENSVTFNELEKKFFHGYVRLDNSLLKDSIHHKKSEQECMKRNHTC